MKLAAVLSALALAVAPSHAEECSLLDIGKIVTKTEFIQLGLSCNIVALTQPPATDAESIQQFCSTPACVKAVQAAREVAPTCEVSGVSFITSFDTILTGCEAITGTMSPASAPEPAPSSSASAMAAVGIAAAAVATAALTMTHV